MHISSWTQTKGILFFLYLPPLLCRWLSFSIHSWYSTTAPSPSQLALLVELTWLIQLTHVWKVPVPTGGPAGQSGTAMTVTAPSGMMGGTARKVSRSALFLPNWLFFFLAQWHVWGSFYSVYILWLGLLWHMNWNQGVVYTQQKKGFELGVNIFFAECNQKVYFTFRRHT